MTEKQIKISKIEGSKEQEEWWCEWFNCPACEKKGEIACNFKYCPNCGVKLEWTK